MSCVPETRIIQVMQRKEVVTAQEYSETEAKDH